jgi:4-amino-4-deoxy-L-arabinose transferase-like glycosyltransferase
LLASALQMGRTTPAAKAQGNGSVPGSGVQPSLLSSLALLAIFVITWTVYDVISSAPAAIHNDMAEAYVWGREFQLGYLKHPPFWAWIAGLWFEVFPRADWAFALLAMLNAGLGLYGSWTLIGDFADGDRRRAATVLLLLTPFYTFLAFKYNANSIFLSLWPWTMHFFVRSVDDRRLPDAILFGLFIGLALLSKYYALILGATCFVAVLVHPERRTYFASASPYVSFGIAALLFAPHVWWLARSDAPPVQYFMTKTGLGTAAFVACAAFLGGVVGFHATIVALIALTKGPSPKPWAVALRMRWSDPKFRMLTTLAVLPLVLTLVAGVAFRLRPSTNMTIAIFSLMPLLLLELSGGKGDERLYRLSRALVVGLTLIALVLSPAIAIAKIWFGDDNNYSDPRKELAREATKIWHEITGSPLQYVAGSQRYENAVAFYSPDRPHVFIHFDSHQAPWVTPEDLDQGGLLVVCAKEDKKCLTSSASYVATPQARRTELTLTHSFWGYTAPPVSFIVTVVPPHR